MRGRRSGSWNSGPQLPFKLTREIEGGSGGSLGGRHGGHGSRKDRRKAERQAKKHHGKPENSSFKGKKRGREVADEEQEERRSSKEGRFDEKKQRHGSGGSRRDTIPPPKSSTKFSELAPGAKQAGATFPTEDAELALQRELARKLGLKKGKKAKFGEEDGLDELMDELGGFDDVFGDDSNGDGGPAAPKLCPKQPKKYHASAPSDSDEDEGEEESENGDSEDDGLRGLSDSDDGGTSEEEESEEDGLDGLLSSDTDREADDAGLNLLDQSSEEESSGDDAGEASSDGDTASGDDKTADASAVEKLPKARKQETRPTNGRIAADTPAEGGGTAEKYVPPAVRRAQLAAAGAADHREAEVTLRRVRGLLNRLAEANLQGIVGELSELYQNEGRSLVSNAVSSELISAAAEGPRASERFAIVAAAAITGLAALSSSSEVVATFLARLATSLEDSMARDDSLSCGNLVQVLAHLYLCGAVKGDVLYSVLEQWREGFSEKEVAAMAGLLNVAGLGLRAADPERMKEFVVAVHARAGEVGQLPMRARVMLDLVVDIKNNRKRDDGRKKAAAALPPAVGKWLRSVGAESVAVGGISWKKIVFGDKRGMWWMPTAADAAANLAAAGGGAPSGAGLSGAAAAAAAAGAGADAGLAAPELAKLAAAMRMNTDARRAVFFAIMGSEDAVDATEKLLRLGLKGEQEREVVRVAVECCLHEASFNPYYAHLLTRLCSVAKGHRVTLQFCLWDHFKEVAGLPVRRLTVLARLSATIVALGALPPSMLKVIDFTEALSAREVLFWRLFFEHLLAGCKKDAEVTALFERVTAQQQLSGLRVALLAFLKRTVGPWLAMKDPEDAANGGAERLAVLLRRCRAAERALASTA